MSQMRNGLLFGLALAALAPAVQAATLNGATLSASYRYPDAGTVYPLATPTGPFVVGAGVDGVIDVEGVTQVLLDFDDNTLTVTLNTVLSSPTWTNTAFNGVRIELESAGSFSSFALASSSFAPIETSFEAGALLIDWSGATYMDGSSAVFDVGFDVAPVPLPAALPLLCVGLGSIAMLRRRRAR